ncbi:hypothetical protein GCM10009647_085790 [Streptomyces sanglieri]
MSKWSPSTKDELEESLDELVQRAYQNGVSVSDCGYELLHNDESIPDWDLKIIRLKRR